MLPFHIEGVWTGHFQNTLSSALAAVTDFYAQVLSIYTFHSTFLSVCFLPEVVKHKLVFFGFFFFGHFLCWMFWGTNFNVLAVWYIGLSFSFSSLGSGIWKEMRRPILFYVLLEWVFAGILKRLLRLCFAALHHCYL